MHLTLEADYAVRIVYCLAKNGIRMDAKKIAEKTCVTLRFSLKILRNLVAAGLIKSFKGTQGGYELAKKPEEITLREVIEAVEGRYMFSRCLGESYECSRTDETSACPFCRVYEEISQDVRKKLESVTMASFL